MAFIDRMDHEFSGSEKRNNHLMAAEAWTWMRGENNRGVFVVNMRLDASDDAQLDQLVAHYNGLNNNQKLLFFNDFSSWTVRLELETVTRGDFMSRFGLT